MVRKRFTGYFGILAGVQVCLVWISFQTVQAQDTHRNIMADITLQCFASEVTPFSKDLPLQLVGSGHAQIVSGEVEAQLLERGFTLINSAESLRLDYEVELANVVLKRNGRNRLDRTVSLGLTFKLFEQAVDTSNKLIDSGTCSSERTDTIQRDAISALSYEGFPETSPAVPAKGGWKRFIKPAVLIGATAVGTYLFFNLRSRRSDSG